MNFGAVRGGQPVVLLLAVVALAALLGLGVLSHAPNRLLSGRPLMLLSAFGLPHALALVALTAGMAMLALRPGRPARSIANAVIAAAALAVLLAAAGAGADRIAESAAPAARTSLAAGFWVAALAYGFALRTTLQEIPRSVRAAISTALAASIVALFASGALNELSLLKEFFSRRAEFVGALTRHAAIALLGVVPAVLVGGALGLLAYRRARAGGPIFAALDTVQVIPSIAVFALLMAPFAALAGRFPSLREWGFGGIGIAPAVVALIVYLLLPVARSVHAGLQSVDRDVVEAAHGMGMSAHRILVAVEAPLALPSFLAGLRIAIVQAIGLTALAALVGAGGLGTFIFQGMGQFALDLVLLGVAPIAALTAVADVLLRALEQHLSERGQ